jgi:hypothetical protein
MKPLFGQIDTTVEKELAAFIFRVKRMKLWAAGYSET